MNIILKNKNIDSMLMHTASAIKGTVMEDGLKELNSKMTVELARKMITNMLKTTHTQPLEQVILQFDIEDVPLIAELFLISSRYIAPVIKSRRYVDFKDKIYKLDSFKGLTPEQVDKVNTIIANRHKDYDDLINSGEKKEDARNILTLMTSTSMSFTINIVELLKMYREVEYSENPFAQEMMHNMVMEVIAKMGIDMDITGERIDYLGTDDFHNAIKWDLFTASDKSLYNPASQFGLLTPRIDNRAIVKEMYHVLSRADRNILRLMDINGKLYDDVSYLNGFMSIAGMTHLLRHRKFNTVFSMDFIISAPHYEFSNAFEPLKYDNMKYKEIYLKHISEVEELLSDFDDVRVDVCVDVRRFLSLCGMKTKFVTHTDAEGMVRFMNLRMCNRAQNEIASFAKYIRQTLAIKGIDVSGYITSCDSLGYCPEGKFTCGKMKNK